MASLFDRVSICLSTGHSGRHDQFESSIRGSVELQSAVFKFKFQRPSAARTHTRVHADRANFLSSFVNFAIVSLSLGPVYYTQSAQVVDQLAG